MRILIANKEQIESVIKKYHPIEQQILKELINTDVMVYDLAEKYYVSRKTITRLINKLKEDVEKKYGKVHL